MNSIFITATNESHELISEFTVKGEPVSKSRARFTKRGSKTIAYTPQKTLDGEKAVKAAFLAAKHQLGTDTDSAYAVRAHFFSGTRQRRDVDNMAKLILDGLNGVAWVDDNQVLEIAARKSFVPKDEARTEVQIFLIGDMEFEKESCRHCGQSFRTYESWNKKFCTRKCQQDWTTEKATRDCAHCGVTFRAEKATSETRYCSIECSREGRRQVVPCNLCGNDFSKQRCHVRKTNYCSDECRLEQDRRSHKDRRSKHFPGACSTCGGGTTRKEYVRCNPCKKRGAIGKPGLAPSDYVAPSKATCSTVGCEDQSRTRGMCGKHYTRWYREQKASS